jgi:outer membrane protein
MIAPVKRQELFFFGTSSVSAGEMSIERKLISLALLCLGVLLSTTPAADAQKPLTLADCIKLASSAPGPLGRAGLGVAMAQAGVGIARAAFLPQMQITNSFTYNSPPLPEARSGAPNPFSFLALNGIREYQSFGAVTEEIDTSGRLRAALQRAEADRQIAETSAIISVRDLKRAVTSSYYTLLLARHLIQVEQDLSREAENFAGVTETRFANGEVARLDPLKANAQVEHFHSALQAAELAAKTANCDLASFWTNDVAAPLNILDTLAERTPPQPHYLTGRPFLRRPELSLFAFQEMGLKADARRARAYLYPQLGISFEYGIDANRIAWYDRGYAVIASLNIPVFDWFRTRNEAKQFDFEAQQAQIDRLVATRLFSRAYYDALQRVETISSQIDLVAKQVDDLRQNLDLVRLRHQGGESLALEVVDAQNLLAQAEVEYYTLFFDYEIAKSDLEVASGQ